MTTEVLAPARHYRLLCAFALSLSCMFGSQAICADTPPPKQPAISNVAVVQRHKPPKQGSFKQQVRVTFKTAVPNQTDLDNVTKWRIIVNFDDGSTIELLGKEHDCLTVPSATSCWSITKTNNDGTVTQQDGAVQMENPPAPPVLSLSALVAVITLPEGTITEHATSLDVSFGTAISPVWSAKQAICSSTFCSASNKSTADNYLSGTYSPAIHSAAQYTIDAKGSYVKQLRLSPFYMGAIATVSTDQRPSADPDSFLVSGVLQTVLKDTPFNKKSAFWSRAQTVILNWDFAGLEFDRQTTTKTFISSPIVEIPFRVFGSSKSTCSMGMFPYFGIETGTNLSNAINPNGSGFVFRGEAGSSISFKIKSKKWKVLSQISMTSNYTARIPAVSEIFTNTHYISETGKTVSLYSMSTQTRNHLKDELDFTVAKPLSITVKHEYGELPPGFRTIHNKVTIGLTLMLFQNNTASSTVSAEQ